jgi:hypothetical protein
LVGNYREILALFAVFRRKASGISLHLKPRGGARGIRTFGTFSAR